MSLRIHPGRHAQEEMLARRWKISDMVRESMLPREIIFDVVNERCDIDDAIATGLSRAFGTSKELWLNLQQNYTTKSEVLP